MKRGFSLKSRLYMLLLICVVPLTILLAYLLIMTNKISSEYDLSLIHI